MSIKLLTGFKLCHSHIKTRQLGFVHLSCRLTSPILCDHRISIGEGSGLSLLSECSHSYSSAYLLMGLLMFWKQVTYSVV